MEHISSFDAKTHLSRLLTNVMAGKEYVITRHNKEVARLSPCRHSAQDVQNAINAIQNNMAKAKATAEEIQSYRTYGRR